MADDDQPAWAVRLENKLDAVLECLRQMEWNREQALKVITQSLAGEVPKIDE